MATNPETSAPTIGDLELRPATAAWCPVCGYVEVLFTPTQLDRVTERFAELAERHRVERCHEPGCDYAGHDLRELDGAKLCEIHFQRRSVNLPDCVICGDMATQLCECGPHCTACGPVDHCECGQVKCVTDRFCAGCVRQHFRDIALEHCDDIVNGDNNDGYRPARERRPE